MLDHSFKGVLKVLTRQLFCAEFLTVMLAVCSSWRRRQWRPLWWASDFSPSLAVELVVLPCSASKYRPCLSVPADLKKVHFDLMTQNPILSRTDSFRHVTPLHRILPPFWRYTFQTFAHHLRLKMWTSPILLSASVLPNQWSSHYPKLCFFTDNPVFSLEISD